MIPREDFDEICDPFDLLRFCNTYEEELDGYRPEQLRGVEECDIYSSGDLNAWVFDSVAEARDWTDIRNIVKDIPDNCDWYLLDYWGDFVEFFYDDAFCELEEYIANNVGFDEDEKDGPALVPAGCSIDMLLKGE